MTDVFIRPIESQDIQPIADAFAAIGWGNKTVKQYERYIAEQQNGVRRVLLAFVDAQFAGYLTIVWQPGYAPYRDNAIPEVQDLNVLPAFRRRGIASRLMDEAERIVLEAGRPVIGIGFGMTADYGAAQKMYVLRGYVPDGLGLSYDDRILQHGDTATVDDSLVFHLTKTLRI